MRSIFLDWKVKADKFSILLDQIWAVLKKSAWLHLWAPVDWRAMLFSQPRFPVHNLRRWLFIPILQVGIVESKDWSHDQVLPIISYEKLRPKHNKKNYDTYYFLFILVRKTFNLNKPVFLLWFFPCWDKKASIYIRTQYAMLGPWEKHLWNICNLLFVITKKNVFWDELRLLIGEKPIYTKKKNPSLCRLSNTVVLSF
jgi:hypothetical protein